VKPEFEKIIKIPQKSFIAKKVIRESRPLLTQAWHFHPEIEICFTIKSEGKRFVGNNISEYVEGDLVMIGSNIPHGFTTFNHCEQVVIQLNQNFLGKEFLKKPESKRVNDLFERSRMGLQFSGNAKLKAQKQIKSILKKEGFDKLLHLLKLLSLLSNTDDFEVICTKAYSNTLNLDQLGRIKRIFDFIENNFKKDISITHAANLINLTESAFYKFIKRHTKKKFTQIINEYRVNHASKMLINTEFTVSEICYESGFNNLSYFNRKFKNIIGSTPSDFRIKFT
jgi:AraC-like DNA-binding protein